MTTLLKIIATIPWVFFMIFFSTMIFWGEVTVNGIKRPLGIAGRIIAAILAIFTWYIMGAIYN